MDDVQPLAGTRWYVPAANLLAYLTDPGLRVHTPVADQTLWSITAADGGRFSGTSQTTLWMKGPGGLQQGGTSSFRMDGHIAENGDITIRFTPDDPSQAETTGYGNLRNVDGAWRMEMQMATGTQLLALHWAYMTRLGDGEMPPAPSERSLDGGLRSGEWRWMAGSAWSASDAELFPDGAGFTIGSYRNGYFWGEGETSEGQPLRTAGSVTPEGGLYILFSVAGAPAAARRGVTEGDAEACRMTWSQPSGGDIIGGAGLTRAPAE